MKKYLLFLLIQANLLVLTAQNTTTNEPYQLYTTQIAAAEAFFQLNQVSTAKNYLDLCEHKYRDVEWYFLKACLDQSVYMYEVPGQATYASIKMSPDGKKLAAASSDNSVVLFAYPEMQKVGELKGHTGQVSTLAFSSDGKKLASGGRDHTVIIWDLETGKQLIRNSGSFSQGIYQVRFNPDDSLLGVVSWERLRDKVPPVRGFVKLLDVVTGSELKNLETDPHPAAGLVFLNDMKTMVVASWGEVVYSFDVSSGKINWKYDLSDPAEYNAFHSIDLSSDGKIVALGSTDHRIHLLNSQTGEVAHRIESWQGHSKTVKSVQFSPDGKWLASSGEDHTILIWNTNDYSKSAALSGHVQTVSSLCWSQNGDYLLSSSLDNTVRKWDVLQPFGKSYEICHYGPWQTPVTTTGTYFAAPCSDQKLVVYDIASQTPVINLGAQSGLCADFSADGKKLVTASFDGVVRLWDISSGKETRTFTGHQGRIDGVACIDGKSLVASVGDSTLRIWSMATGKAVKTIKFGDMPFRVVVTPDESKICIGFGNGTVKILDSEIWSEITDFKCSALQEMSISHSGNCLAVFGGKNIEIWDIATASQKLLLTGHQQVGYGIGFSHDDRYLISGSYDQTFKFWNLETGVCTFTWHGFQDVVYSCKFISDKKLLIGSSQGKIWNYSF